MAVPLATHVVSVTAARLTISLLGKARPKVTKTEEGGNREVHTRVLVLFLFLKCVWTTKREIFTKPCLEFRKDEQARGYAYIC
jgi:hypothetical protein